MSAVVKSLPIPWSNLPGSAKDRLSSDALLLAQDAAAIQDAYYLDIYSGMNPSELSKQHNEINYKMEVIKFRNTVERLIRGRARVVKKHNNRTDLSVWFSKVASALHKETTMRESLKLANVRTELSQALFSVSGSDVKAYFVSNPDPKAVNRETLFAYLVGRGLDVVKSKSLVDELDNISIDTDVVDVKSKKNYLERANILGLYPIRQFLTDEQTMLLVIVSYGLASNMVAKYSIGRYALITLACHIIYNVGYREFKLYVLAEKIEELQQRPLVQIIDILRKKHVPEHYINELNRFFN